jgi:hypothetical protein
VRFSVENNNDSTANFFEGTANASDYCDLYIYQKTNRMVLVCMGTGGPGKWAQWEGNIAGLVPGVWYAEMQHLTEQIVEKVMRAAQATLDVKTCTIELCGHSRGGAIAGHCAAELGKQITVQHVITFGSCGMSNCVDTSHVGHLFHHVMDKCDPVPMVFGCLGQYPGNLIKFTNFREQTGEAHELKNYQRFVSTTMKTGTAKRASVRKNSGTAQTCQNCGKVRTCPNVQNSNLSHYEIDHFMTTYEHFIWTCAI